MPYTIRHTVLVPAAIKQIRREGRFRLEHKSVKSWRKVEREISKLVIVDPSLSICCTDSRSYCVLD